VLGQPFIFSIARRPDEAGHLLYARDPRSDRGIGSERNATLVAEGDVGHAGDVGDRRTAERQPIVVLQVLIHQPENSCCVLTGFNDVELISELVVKPRLARAALDLVFGDHQPVGDPREGQGIERQPRLVPPFARDVYEDRLAVAENDVAILEDRNFAEWIEVDERAFLMGARQKIDGHDFERHAKERA
jgi:hypothetical protein